MSSEIYNLIVKIFPICRSITGNGVRRTFDIIREYIPDLVITEVPSGTKCFDWEVPNEWNINDAYISRLNGEKVIDFNDTNLHVVGYSIPINKIISIDELQEKLYSLPEKPTAIPYVISFYEKDWGFCISHNQRKQMIEKEYKIYIDSKLEKGNLTYGEIIIPGKSKKEILLSTYICHPSMANNELSGPAVVTFIAKYLLSKKEELKYTYRIIFVPETIGTIVYLSKHYEEMKKNITAGYVVTCIGDPGVFSYLQTRCSNALVDRVTMHALKYSDIKYNVYDYLERGSDEKQYNYPSIDLPVGSLMRSKHNEYDEYHTSLDNLDFVTSEALDESLLMYIKCIEIIENNNIYIVTTTSEPMLSKYGLYPNRGVSNKNNAVRRLRDILSFCDGKNDLLWIADRLKCPIWELYDDVKELINVNLIKPKKT